MVWGKIIGALIGFALGHGLMGAVIGVVVGHWVDVRVFGKNKRPPPRTNHDAQMTFRQQVFSTSVVNLAAKLAKVDGAVTREEVDAFKMAFAIPPAQRAGVGALYDQAKRDAGGYEIHAQRLADAFADAPVVRAEVLEALHRIALADGALHPSEKIFLDRVATIFGLTGRNFSAPSVDRADPYAVLGVARGAPMSEIKAAWRRLTREHHPDTLMAKGMPSDYIDLATKKMAAINAAYDSIRAERGDA